MIVLKILLGLICWFITVFTIACGVDIGIKSYFKNIHLKEILSILKEVENENKSSE